MTTILTPSEKKSRSGRAAFPAVLLLLAAGISWIFGCSPKNSPTAPTVNPFAGTWKITALSGSWSYLDLKDNNTYKVYGGTSRNSDMYEAGTYNFTGTDPDYTLTFVITDDRDGANGFGSGNGSSLTAQARFSSSTTLTFTDGQGQFVAAAVKVT